jgi:hypothetical protein
LQQTGPFAHKWARTYDLMLLKSISCQRENMLNFELSKT